MKTLKTITFLFFVFISLNTVKAQTVGTLDYDCSAKPSSIDATNSALGITGNNAWNDAKMLFADGVLTMKNDGTPYYPYFEIQSSSRDIRATQIVSILVKTNITGKKLKFELYRRGEVTNNSTSILFDLNVSGTGNWEVLTMPYPGTGVVYDFAKACVISLREADGATFASGDVQIDRILVGGTIPAIVTPPAPTDPITITPTMWRNDCNSKPANVNNWNDAKITFADNVMTVSNDGGPLYPQFTFANEVNILSKQYVTFKIKTTTAGKKLKVELFKPAWNSWNNGMLNVLVDVPSTGNWETVVANIPTNDGWAADNMKYMTMSFREADGNTFASGTFMIDEIVVGGDVSTATKSVISRETSIYPTVVSSQLVVNSASKVSELTIYSLNGSKVMQLTGTINSVDVSALRAGTYIAKLKTSEGVVAQRFIKK